MNDIDRIVEQVMKSDPAARGDAAELAASLAYEDAAKVAEEIAERDRKAAADDPQPEPFASNRVWWCGKNIAAAIRAKLGK